MDARVGDAMSWYWASFGKAGDPNSSHAPVLWPAWGKGRNIGYEDTTGAAAIAAIIAAGGGGEFSPSGVFADAWSEGVAGGGDRAALFLDINSRPEVKESQRDCVCEFWDRVRYRY
ncbi:unnamed protein product [Sphacelaria rigidula]